MQRTNQELLKENLSLKSEVMSLKDTISKTMERNGKVKLLNEDESDFSRDLDAIAPEHRDDKDKSRKKKLEKEEEVEVGEQFVLQFNPNEKLLIDNYMNKFIEKFFKIYNKLNVKVQSKEVLS